MNTKKIVCQKQHVETIWKDGRRAETLTSTRRNKALSEKIYKLVAFFLMAFSHLCSSSSTRLTDSLKWVKG